MKGRRGLIMGVANDHSIAWGIAKALAAQGAELAFTFQGEAQAKRVRPLAQSLGCETVLPCDVENLASVDSVFETLRARSEELNGTGDRLTSRTAELLAAFTQQTETLSKAANEAEAKAKQMRA